MAEERVDAAHWDEVEEATELLHEERFYEALANLREVIKNTPTNAYAYYYTGVAFFEVGELEPARDAYQACLRLAPEHLGGRVALCHVLRMLGNTREAVREGMTALSQKPRDGDALHAVGLAYLAQNDYLAAKKYLEAFLETGPEFEAATEARGILANLAVELPN